MLLQMFCVYWDVAQIRSHSLNRWPHVHTPDTWMAPGHTLDSWMAPGHTLKIDGPRPYTLT